jgi:hypothetical protein
VARAALDLFARQGFDETTVDEIAVAAAGIGRRTFFRSYDSKLVVVWGEFDDESRRLHALLVAAPRDRPVIDVLRWAVVTANRFDADEQAELRVRIRLISTVPSLVAHSAVIHDLWCTEVATYVAGRPVGRGFRRPLPPGAGPGRPRCLGGRMQPLGGREHRVPHRGGGPGHAAVGRRIRRTGHHRPLMDRYGTPPLPDVPTTLVLSADLTGV